MAKWRNLRVTYKVEKAEQQHMPLFLAQCIVGHLVTEGEGFWDGVSIHFLVLEWYVFENDKSRTSSLQSTILTSSNIAWGLDRSARFQLRTSWSRSIFIKFFVSFHIKYFSKARGGPPD